MLIARETINERSTKAGFLRSFFNVATICPIPITKVKVTIPSRIREPTRSVMGETLRFVKVAITNGSKNTPSIANKSQLGPKLIFVGRSAYNANSYETRECSPMWSYAYFSRSSAGLLLMFIGAIRSVLIGRSHFYSFCAW